MKKFFALLFLLALIYPTFAFGQFEGEINMKITSERGDAGRQHTVNMFIKGGMMAMKASGLSPEAKDATIIYRDDKKVMWIVSDENKSVFEIPMDKEVKDAAARAMKKSKEEKKAPNVRKSGKSESILGYTCEGWIVDDEDEVQEVYGTSKLGNLYEGFIKTMSQMSKGAPDDDRSDWQHELMKMKIFPLKIVTKRDGKITETMEVTKVNEKKIAASMFEVPAGYKKQSMGEIGNMMQKMQEEMMKGKKEGKGENIDMQKMMEQMKKQMKQLEKEHAGQADSSKDEEENE